MLFNSVEFILFFPAVVIGYFWIVPAAWRWLFLLLASCCFYMAFIPEYILILLLTIGVDYAAGLWIEKSQGRRRSVGGEAATGKILLWSSILVTCAILFFFKYLDFAFSIFNQLRESFDVQLSEQEKNRIGLYLPIGLSFHTFQSLSYVIEVYRGQQRAERHFGIYALYVLFFPQLVAGPIERPQNLLHQFHETHFFNIPRAVSGLRLILWGAFLKTVVADRLGLVVDAAYSDVPHASSELLFLASVFFSFQIYADFQGYTCIARGAARVLGFELVKNFNRPYAAATVGEFWRRWHMSLSTWFRDYVYLPLGGSRRGPWRSALNLMITFLISGLWHGANWTFLIWGGLNGIYVVIEKAIGLHWQRLRPLGVLVTYLLTLPAWVFFRADTVETACKTLLQLPAGFLDLGARFFNGSILSESFFRSIKSSGEELIIALTVFVLMEIGQFLEGEEDFGQLLAPCRWFSRWALYLTGLLIVLYSWMYFPESKKPFIYFQF
ncbi:MAG: membrane-bound O-acyltransferase family protein [Bdellovibrio sp.]|nr:MAG: membrane-bound O-acyltransferase family protein [Bdellovibrio sp.]